MATSISVSTVFKHTKHNTFNTEAYPLLLDPNCMYLPQISMSVLRTVMAVVRCVRTQKGALSVAATLDMNSMEMAAHAMVSSFKLI